MNRRASGPLPLAAPTPRSRVVIGVLALWGVVLAGVLGLVAMGPRGLAGAALVEGGDAGYLLGLGINTLGVALGGAAVATLLSLPLSLGAMLLVSARWRMLYHSLVVAPLFVPPAVVAVAACWFMGVNGPVMRAWYWANPTEGLRDSPIFSLVGVAGTLAWAYFPVVYLVQVAALRRLDTSMIEAALLEAGAARVLLRLVVPSIAPALVPGTVLFFLLASIEFAIPEALRGQPVLVTEVYIRYGVFYDSPAALAAALPLAVGSLVALMLVGMLGWRGGATEAPDSLQRLPALGRRRVAAAAAWTGAALPIGLLVGTLAATLGGRGGVVEMLSMAWRIVGEEFRQTLLLAGAGAAVSLPAGLALGWALARLRRPLAARLLVLGTFVLPGPIIGVAFKVATNLRPGALPWGIGDALAALDPTTAPLIAAYVLKGAPVVALLVEAALRRVPSEFRAMALLEAPPVRGALATWGPAAVMPALVAGFLVAMALAVGEAGATLLLVPPGTTTLSVRLLTLMHVAPTSQVSALSLLMALMVVACGAAGMAVVLLARRRQD